MNINASDLPLTPDEIKELAAKSYLYGRGFPMLCQMGNETKHTVEGIGGETDKLEGIMIDLVDTKIHEVGGFLKGNFSIFRIEKIVACRPAKEGYKSIDVTAMWQKLLCSRVNF